VRRGLLGELLIKSVSALGGKSADGDYRGEHIGLCGDFLHICEK